MAINNLPVAAYQNFMVQVFGENWIMAGEYINTLTFGIIGLALTGTVCFNPQFPHTCNFVQFIALMILAYIDKAMAVAPPG